MPTPTQTTAWDKQRTTFPPKTRRRILHRDNHICQLNYEGCTTTATEADHIVGYAQARRLGWLITQIHHEHNGQGTCPHCHNIKTHHEIAAGQQHAQQTRPKQNPKHTKHPGKKQDNQTTHQT